jgi:hypothetical protein
MSLMSRLRVPLILGNYDLAMVLSVELITLKFFEKVFIEKLLFLTIIKHIWFLIYS